MEEDYNRNVDLFREKEYPMFQGKTPSRRSLPGEAYIMIRCRLPRSCWHHSTLEVADGEIHG
jgi:hypothetical protein